MRGTPRLVSGGGAARVLLCACAAAVLSYPLRADPGHEITIADLTRQIEATPGFAELYFQRAWNYREMPDLAAARRDFEKTLALNPAFLPAKRELARMDAEEGRLVDGIKRLQEALRAPAPDQSFHVPGCWSALADLLLRADRNEEALTAAKTGIKLQPEISLDLCLNRSEAQRRLGKHQDRVRDLAEVMERLHSFVLRISWLEALIDAGRGEEALEDINREIEQSRFTASWLIRRARIELQRSDKAAAEKDLRAAVQEIETRLRPGKPDLSLICDRGAARALLGDMEGARADLAQARAGKADRWMTRLLEALTVATSPAPAPSGAP